MTGKVQKIRNEVERLQNELIQEREKGYGSDVDDACILELQNVLTFIDSLQEEPVSKGFETALAEMIDKAQKCVVEPWVVAAQWKDYLIELAKSEEPVSDDLGEYINELSKQFPEVSFAKLSRIAVRVAQWQKQQMVAKAIDGYVIEDVGNGDFVLSADYLPKSVGLKDQQSVKVIVIKEN